MAKVTDKRKILANMAQCLVCKDVLRSYNTHDFCKCSCGNLAIDGGTSYLKRSAKDKRWKELSIFDWEETKKEGEPNV